MLALLDVMFVLSVTSPNTYVAIALLLSASLWLWPGRSRRARLVLVTLVGAATLAIRFVDSSSPIKSFVKDLYSIRPGSSVAEAEGIMGKYIRGTGWPGDPLGRDIPERELTIPGAIVFRPSGAAGDSNWGVVWILDGRVVRVEFSPD